RQDFVWTCRKWSSTGPGRCHGDRVAVQRAQVLGDVADLFELAAVGSNASAGFGERDERVLITCLGARSGRLVRRSISLSFFGGDGWGRGGHFLGRRFAGRLRRNRFCCAFI